MVSKSKRYQRTASNLDVCRIYMWPGVGLVLYIVIQVVPDADIWNNKQYYEVMVDRTVPGVKTNYRLHRTEFRTEMSKNGHPLHTCCTTVEFLHQTAWQARLDGNTSTV